MSDIVQFNFQGDNLDCVKEGPDLWVSVRRMCEALVIADRPQREKLQNKSWARGTLIVSPDARGHNQKQFFLHVESVPMWLATIEETRVSSTSRPKLVKFQLEAAKALRDHFFGNAIVPNNLEEALLLAAGLERDRKALAAKVDADRPKVEFAMAVKVSVNAISLGEMARVLNNTEIDTGRNRLIVWMREEKILFGPNNLPYQRYLEAGYFVVKESTYTANGKPRTGLSTRVTGKGQTWLEMRFRKAHSYNTVEQESGPK